MPSIKLEAPYPLEEKWRDIRDQMEESPIPPSTGLTRDRYLDVAERMVRTLAVYQDETGAIVDPYHTNEPHLIHFASKSILGAPPKKG